MNLYRSYQAPEEERLSPLDRSTTEKGYITVKTDERLSPLNKSLTESEGYITVKTEERSSPLNNSSTESEGFITVKTDDRISPLNKSSTESEGYITVKTEERLSPLNESSTESEGYLAVKTDDRISPLNKSSPESEGYVIVKNEPHDSDSETNGGILDYDYNLGRGVASPRSGIHGHTDVFSHEHSGDHNHYTKVQESDAAMPQRIEPDRSQQFDIIIKSEPLEGDW